MMNHKYFVSADKLRKRTPFDNKYDEQMAIKQNYPDESGFVFLTNIQKGDQLPFDYAQERGIFLPQFEIRSAWLPPVLTEALDKPTLEEFQESHEGVYVRPGYYKQQPRTFYLPKF